MPSFWSLVSTELQRANEDPALRALLDDGQRRSLRFVAKHLPRHGLVLADEVGTGKTRIACALVDAVIRCGGRAVVVVPRGLLGQWRDEFRTIRRDRDPRQLTTWLEFLEDGSGARQKGEWWLVSHGFRFPSLQAGSPSWKFALPWLVRLAAEEGERLDGRTRLSRLWAQVNLSKKRWKGQWAIAETMAKRLPADIRAELTSLPLPDWDAHANPDLTDLFARHERGQGLRVVDRLMSRWIGRVDLLVVDEAHKSRDFDVNDAPRTVLSELLEYVVDTDGESRRFCLTATPMELSEQQWKPLLHRARADVDGPRLDVAVAGLRAAVDGARIAPDEELQIAALESAARQFQQALAPYVTRRRRREEPLLQEFRRKMKDSDLPHPHRNVERLPIRWDRDVQAAGPEWRRVLFALEGVAASARGLDAALVPHAVKTLHTKLASAHAVDLLDEDRLTQLFGAETSPKQRRFLYWCKEYESARRAQRRAAESLGLDGFDPDTEHPRILASVDEIERWATSESPEHAEKVLCFGVFLRPLRMLRDVLNVRHALRCLDRGEPVASSFSSFNAVAYRNYERMQLAGVFKNRLRGELLSPGALAKRLDQQLRLHQNERKKIARTVDRIVLDELARRSIDLDAVTLGRLNHALHTMALDARRAGEPDTAWHEEFARVMDDREDAGGADADSSPESQLRLWIDAHHDEDSDSRGAAGFCRLLQGSSEWVTRRSLQASFNRPARFPMVLLAQSLVGREGLNLHKACRVVVQFHAEWNPAILEQQIGRVDRMRSKWEDLATEWMKRSPTSEPAPKVEVRQVVFDGTYDASQWERVGRRQHLFDAALFGSLLPLDAWLRASAEHRRRLEIAAPDFSPP